MIQFYRILWNRKDRYYEIDMSSTISSDNVKIENADKIYMNGLRPTHYHMFMKQLYDLCTEHNYFQLFESWSDHPDFVTIAITWNGHVILPDLNDKFHIEYKHPEQICNIYDAICDVIERYHQKKIYKYPISMDWYREQEEKYKHHVQIVHKISDRIKPVTIKN